MERNRKLLILVMTVCALLVLPVTVAAMEPEGTDRLETIEFSGTVELFQCGSLTGEYTRPGEVNLFSNEDTIEQQIYDQIYAGLLAQQETITVVRTDLAITQENFDSFCQLVVDLYERVVNDHPRLFYVSGGYSVNGKGDQYGLQVTLTPAYIASVTAEQIAAFDLAVEEAKAQVAGITDDMEKMLILHDYLAVKNAYNWEVATTGTSEDKLVWSAYAALVQGDPVCQGYALAYKLLLNELGMNCITVSSEPMRHMWNMVQIGESWYHVDITWDDSTPNTEGRCGHTYFLLSDDAIFEEPTYDATTGAVVDPGNHYGWEEGIPVCTSAAYESGWVFCTSNHQIFLRDGTYYYINISGQYALYKTNALNNEGTKVANLSNFWHAGYGIVWLNDYVYYVPYSYAAQRTLKACSLDSGEITEIGTFDFTETAVDKYPASNDYIGLRVSDTGAKIEVVSSTRREVLYSTDIRDYPVEWGNLTLASGEQAKLVGLHQARDGALKAGILLSEEVSEPMVLCAAFYDSSHKMTGLRYVTVSAGSSGLQVVTLGSAAIPAYETVSLFLADSTYAPLCGKWSKTA